MPHFSFGSAKDFAIYFVGIIFGFLLVFESCPAIFRAKKKRS